MGWDGSGNIQRTNGTNSGTTVWQDDRDDGVNIRADRHDTHDEDLAGAIENAIALDGQNTTTTDGEVLRYVAGNNRFEGSSPGTGDNDVPTNSDLNDRGFAQQVDSVSALRSGSYPASLDRIWLSGYYGVGTAGGGPLYRDPDDTTTADNGGTVFVDADGVRWKRPAGKVNNIQEFGATGDGVTDDTAAIQAALDDQGENTGDGRSGTAVYAPEPDVAYLFSSIAHKTVGIIGDGYDDRFRGPQDDSQYQDDDLFGGTVFRSTASSGIAMDFGKATDGSEGSSKPPLAGFILIGATSNSATGIRLGRWLGSGLKEVRVSNFDIGYQFDFFEDCWLLGARAAGCGIGFNIAAGIAGNNQNTFYMTEANQCATGIVIDDGNLNAFYGALLQGSPNLTDGLVVKNGSAFNSFYDFWAEGDWTDDIISVEGADTRKNVFRNWKFNGDGNSISIAGTGASGGNVLEDFTLPGGNTITLTVSSDENALLRISDTITITDNGTKNALMREPGIPRDWQARFDYDRGQPRNSSDRAPLQFMEIDETSANQFIARFVDNDDNELGSLNLRSGGAIEFEDSAGNRAHRLAFDGEYICFGNFRHSGDRVGFFGTGTVAQPATTGTTAGFTAGAGTGVNDDSTFTGDTGSAAYTVGDIVRALKELGLLNS